MPKSHSTRKALAIRTPTIQNTTNSPIDILPPQRLAALEILVTGKSLPQAAKLSGVPRATLYRWFQSDPVFRAAYNRWLDEMEVSCRSRLLALTDTATTTVEKAMKSGNAKLAMELLKGMGMIRQPEKRSLDPDEVSRIAVVKKRRQMASITREEARVEMEERFANSGLDIPTAKLP